MRFVVSVLVNAVAIWVATWLLDGMTAGSTGGTGSLILTYLVISLIFGLVNAVIRPIVVFFSIPFYILTLGLFTLVVNALMLMLTSWLSEQLGLAFHVDDFFWTAVLGAIVISIVSMLANAVLGIDRADD